MTTSSKSKKRSPSAKRARNKRDKARKRGATISEIIYTETLWIIGKGKCGICKLPVDINLTEGDLQPSIDHVTPISKGGQHVYSNTQISHAGCNNLKADIY